MRNLEYKAELRDPTLARTILRRLGAKLIAASVQEDVHYRVPDANLLRRRSDGEPPLWLFYRRQVRVAPKLSTIDAYTEPAALARFGSLTLPVCARIEKSRQTWLLGAVRVLLDQAPRLGRFIEIEMRISPSGGVVECRDAISAARRALWPAIGEPIASGYRELAIAEAGLHSSRPELPPPHAG